MLKTNRTPEQTCEEIEKLYNRAQTAIDSVKSEFAAVKELIDLEPDDNLSVYLTKCEMFAASLKEVSDNLKVSFHEPIVVSLAEKYKTSYEESVKNIEEFATTIINTSEEAIRKRTYLN